MHLRTQLLFSSIFAATGITILALAAHYLQKILPEAQVNSIKTAANIQLIHSVAIVALSNLHATINLSALKRALNFMIAGIIAFSFSIYILSLNKIFELSWLKILGPITPIGGILLIISWSIISIHIYKSTK